MSSSVLATTYSLTLGNQRWTTQAVDVSVTLEAAPLIDRARITFPAAAPVEAAPGDSAVIDLDGGSGDGTVAVLTGTVRAVARGARSIVVECVDAGAALAAYRPATSFEQTSAASVVRALCDDVGVDVGAVDTGPSLSAYVADPSRSALDHIARLAAFSGALATVDGEGKVTTQVVDGSQPDLALRHDREVRHITQRQVGTDVESYVVAGEAGASSASPPDAARPTSDFFAGDRPDGPGAGTRWSFEPVFRTADAAAVAAAARTRSAQSARHRTTLDTWLLPALRPGVVLRIDELPDGLAGGPHWVERVTHRLGPTGATTRCRLAEGGPAFDPLALLGSLAGALGSLL
jgi:hypothetical protein